MAPLEICFTEWPTLNKYIIRILPIVYLQYFAVHSNDSMI